MTEINLATLGEIMGVGTYDDLVESTGEGRQTESGEAGLLTVPRELRDALASADDLEPVAERWGRTEELEDWRAEDLRAVLVELSRPRGAGSRA